MKVIVINISEFEQFIDTTGWNDANDIISVSPNEKKVVEISNEKQFVNLSKKFKNKLIFKKI